MLIKDIDTIRKFIKVNKDFEFSSIGPYIESAELKYIKPVLGKELYENLNNYIDTLPENPVEKFDKLLLQVQVALSHLAFFISVPVGNILISDSGLQIAETSGVKPAPLWAKEELSSYLSDTGFSFLEAISELLFDNADIYPEWTSDKAFKDFKGGFINTTSEFNSAYSLSCNYQTFSRIRPILKGLEEDLFMGILGEEYFFELKEKILDNDLLTIDETVLNKIQKAIAHLAVSEACNVLPIQFTDAGLIINYLDGVSTNKKTQVPKSEDIQRVETGAKIKGEKYLRDLKDFLNKNASSTTLDSYFNSSAYTNPASITVDPRTINSEDSKILLL